MRGSGLFVPILGLTVPTDDQIGKTTMTTLTKAENEKLLAMTNGVYTPPRHAEASPTSGVPMQRSKPLTVRQEGVNVYAQTSRTSYHAVIGQSYTPFGKTKDTSPKILLALGRVGDDWHVSIGPADGARGRTRGMHLASFLSRYIEGTALYRKSDVKVDRRGMSRLARIEKKLDLLLDQLGVKQEVKQEVKP